MSKFLRISTFKTASRCWVPVQANTNSTMRHFSSRQRCINFNNLNEGFAVSNDDVLRHDDIRGAINLEEPFEPTIFSSEEIHTAGPVNKA